MGRAIQPASRQSCRLTWAQAHTSRVDTGLAGSTAHPTLGPEYLRLQAAISISPPGELITPCSMPPRPSSMNGACVLESMPLRPPCQATVESRIVAWTSRPTGQLPKRPESHSESVPFEDLFRLVSLLDAEDARPNRHQQQARRVNNTSGSESRLGLAAKRPAFVGCHQPTPLLSHGKASRLPLAK